MDPTPAATVVVARPGPDGVEVLVLRRAPGTRFLPGFVVFPGGAVDPGDVDLAVRLFGDPAEAARACAIRELQEETGLLLTADGLVEHRGMFGGRFDPPVPDALVEMARWVAPESLEVRFDARFFAIAAPHGLRPVPDRREAEGAWWVRPADLLDAAERGDGQLMWPTLVTMRALAGCRTVDDVLSLRVEQVRRPSAPGPASPAPPPFAPGRARRAPPP